ncbi:MAG: hypothetical protein CMK07_09815 [Ponticaulis sp.]|nr:hypothetical protein [Ponticaulis sp.]
MSFDLMFFDPAIVRYQDPNEFLDWFMSTTNWEAPVDYNDPQTASPALQAWFNEVIAHNPPMNGPLASDDDDSPDVTDYSIAPDSIYASYSFSGNQAGIENAISQAGKLDIGLFDPQDGTVYLPVDDSDELRPAFKLEP